MQPERDLSFQPISNPTPRHLTQAQIDHYNERGFISPIPVFDAAEIARIRAETDALFDTLASYGDGRDSYAINCYQHRARTIWNLVRDPRITDIVADIAGPNLIAWASHYFCKMPHDNRPVPFHQDASYWFMSPARTVTVWLAIDDTDDENAPMLFLPGSHRQGPLPWRQSDDPNVVLGQELADTESFGTPVANVLPAGSMSLHADMLAHGSVGNLSDRRRCGLTIRYCAPGASKPLDPHYAGRAVLARGEDTTGWWTHNPEPADDDLAPQDDNPIYDVATAAE